MNQAIEKILIEEPVAGHQMTEKAISAQVKAQGFLPEIEIIKEKDLSKIQHEIKKITTIAGDIRDEYDAGKKILILKNARGHQFRTCPGTNGVICCNYHVFNFLSGCPMNCSYCYLTTYLNQPALSLQVNLEKPLGQLIDFFRSQPKRVFRVGTGELADSLALPASDPVNLLLIDAFTQQANCQLELKTKSDRIHSLKAIDPKNKVMISWSMSPVSLSMSEEHETATPKKRLLAAKKVLDWGYQIGFHLDPLMYAHPSLEAWEKDYQEMIEMIFAEIPAEKISWISLGGLRFLKGLKEKMMTRFPDSQLPYQEMVPGSDGKLRYPKPIRKHMFQFISQKIQDLGGTVTPPVYLCMESKEVWRNALGGTPDPRGDLRPLFTQAIS